MNVDRFNRGPVWWLVTATLALSAVLASGPTPAENVDPSGVGAHYAWGENVGWINAQPAGPGGPGMQVDDLALTGWMWGENIGWINLSCVNRQTCADVGYGVTNDACGLLAGYAWAENVGWVDFSPATGGVVIDPQSGLFSGEAWAENVGWIVFADSGPVAYAVQTSWRREPPQAVPEIGITRQAGDLLVTWGAVSDAETYDVMRGSLEALLSSGGDFTSGVSVCAAEDLAGTEYSEPLTAAGEFYLVRPANCGGNGTSDSGGGAQAGGRDGEVEASGTCG